MKPSLPVRSLPQPAAFSNESEAWDQVARHFALSPQEVQVARLLVDGLTRKLIAQAMGIRLSTVRVYIDRLSAKLHVRGAVLIVATIVQFQARANTL
jgi:DNA-binding NarL/FixJ family response regulator